MLTDKRYGFINTEKGDLFFHMSAAPDISCDEFHEDEMVEYEECRGPKGQYAKSVRWQAVLRVGMNMPTKTRACHLVALPHLAGSMESRFVVA